MEHKKQMIELPDIFGVFGNDFIKTHSFQNTISNQTKRKYAKVKTFRLLNAFKFQVVLESKYTKLMTDN